MISDSRAAEQSLAADGAIACSSGNLFLCWLNADRAPQLKASVMRYRWVTNRSRFHLEFESYIFMEIAGQHDRDGATHQVIREGVDYRQKLLLTDSELEDRLKRLADAKLIQRREGKYFISESIVPSLPRTATGQISFHRQQWDTLRRRLFSM